ncbi:TPA: hypothetical protein RI770_001330 [Vibrio cholerae]|nr:hypothetical protein [Vibrio cholerae]HDV5492291.1 hypothetical protein [Vibrio cholerae]
MSFTKSEILEALQSNLEITNITCNTATLKFKYENTPFEILPSKICIKSKNKGFAGSYRTFKSLSELVQLVKSCERFILGDGLVDTIPDLLYKAKVRDAQFIEDCYYKESAYYKLKRELSNNSDYAKKSFKEIKDSCDDFKNWWDRIDLPDNWEDFKTWCDTNNCSTQIALELILRRLRFLPSDSGVKAVRFCNIFYWYNGTYRNAKGKTHYQSKNLLHVIRLQDSFNPLEGANIDDYSLLPTDKATLTKEIAMFLSNTEFYKLDMQAYTKGYKDSYVLDTKAL